MKRTFWFLLFLLGGILCGALVSELASQVSFLRFLCYGESIGVGYPSPVTVDLAVIQFSFGFMIELNLAKFLCIIAAMALYIKIGRRL